MNSCILLTEGKIYTHTPYVGKEWTLPFKIIKEAFYNVTDRRGVTEKKTVYILYFYGYGYKIVEENNVINYLNLKLLTENTSQIMSLVNNFAKNAQHKFTNKIDKQYKYFSNNPNLLIKLDDKNILTKAQVIINKPITNELDIITISKELNELNISKLNPAQKKELLSNKRTCTQVTPQPVKQQVKPQEKMNVNNATCPINNVPVCAVKKLKKNFQNLTITTPKISEVKQNTSIPTLIISDKVSDDNFIETIGCGTIITHVYKYKDGLLDNYIDNCIEICKDENNKKVMRDDYLKNSCDYLLLITAECTGLSKPILVGFAKILIKQLKIELINAETIVHTVTHERVCRKEKNTLTGKTKEQLIEYYDGKQDANTPPSNTTYFYIDVICSGYKGFGQYMLKYLQKEAVLKTILVDYNKDHKYLEQFEWMALRALDHVYYYYPKYGFQRMMPGVIFPLVKDRKAKSLYEELPYEWEKCDPDVCNKNNKKNILPTYFTVTYLDTSLDIKYAVDSYTNGYFYCKKIESESAITTKNDNRNNKAKTNAIKTYQMLFERMPLYIYYLNEESKYEPYYFPFYEIIGKNRIEPTNINDFINIDGDGDVYINIKLGKCIEDNSNDKEIKKLYAHDNIVRTSEIHEFSWYYDNVIYIKNKGCRDIYYNPDILKYIIKGTKLMLYYRDENNTITQYVSIVIDAPTLKDNDVFNVKLANEENIPLRITNYNINCLRIGQDVRGWKIIKE
jgi:hypothetical protein